MLTKDCFLPPFIHLSQPASLLTSIGFRWDDKTGKVVKHGHNRYLVHNITLFIQALSVGVIILQTVIAPEKNLSKMMISSFGLIIIIFCTVTIRVYHRNLRKCITLLNDLISAAKELREPGVAILDPKEKFIKFLAPVFHWSAMAVPFAFVGGVVYTMPCMNSNLGYFLLKECTPSLEKTYQQYGENAGNVLETFVRAIFLTTNLLLWSYSVQGAVFIVIGVVMLGAMSIRSFLKHYERTMLNIPADRKHQKNLLKTALMYRRLQLLTTRFNSIHQLYVLVPLLFTVTSHQVFSVFGAIKFKGQLNLASYTLFFILGSQGVMVIMGMFTALGDVYSTSVKVKRNLEKAHRYQKWLRRFHSACPIIKIRFGTLNYIDSFSPLAFENFAIMQTANILLF